MIHTSRQLKHLCGIFPNATVLIPDADLILNEIFDSTALYDLWLSYQRKFNYAVDVIWDDVVMSVRRLVNIVK